MEMAVPELHTFYACRVGAACRSEGCGRGIGVGADWFLFLGNVGLAMNWFCRSFEYCIKIPFFLSCFSLLIINQNPIEFSKIHLLSF